MRKKGIWIWILALLIWIIFTVSAIKEGIIPKRRQPIEYDTTKKTDKFNKQTAWEASRKLAGKIK